METILGVNPFSFLFWWKQIKGDSGGGGSSIGSVPRRVITRGMGTLLLRSIIFNNPTPLFQYSLQYFSFNIFGTILHFSLSLTRGIRTLLLRSIIFNNSAPFFILSLFFSVYGGRGGYAFQVCAFFVFNRIGIYVAKNRSMGPKKSVQQTFRGTGHAFHRGATAAFLIWAMIGLWPWWSTAFVSSTSDLSYPPPPPPSQLTDIYCSELNQLNIDSL